MGDIGLTEGARAMVSQEPDWAALTKDFPAELVEALRGHFVNGGNLEITARQLANEVNSEEQVATRFLDRVAGTGALDIERKFVCPCDKKRDLTQEQAELDVCASCGEAFVADHHARPAPVAIYNRKATMTRDVRWMLALHGMNTPGAWQESFNWLAARSYGRSVPVAIYKYGIVRPGAILKFRQRALMHDL